MGRARAPGRALRPRFWENVPLAEMSTDEWEALCDGCGRCCLRKIEDADTGEVAYTNVACRLLDDTTARCGNYAIRRSLVPDCVVLTPASLAEHAYWMPETCAYRRLHRGERLPDWHPLLTGRPESVVEAGISMRGRTIPEFEIDDADLEDHVIEDLS